jgi:NarL family two-component system response regulator LiaR
MLGEVAMTYTKKLRILIADDHAVVREGLAAIIAVQPDMQLVGEASNGVEAVDLASALRPDVILLDLVMPRQDGLAAIQAIKQADPQARILVLTSFADDERVFPAIKAGALGYLLKDTSRDQLLQAICDVAEGRATLHPEIALKVMRELKTSAELPTERVTLTEREVETLRLIARGMTNEEIAAALVIHERTVAKYVSSILDKLHLANRTQAALYALREGLADLE